MSGSALISQASLLECDGHGCTQRGRQCPNAKNVGIRGEWCLHRSPQADIEAAGRWVNVVQKTLPLSSFKLVAVSSPSLAYADPTSFLCNASTASPSLRGV